MPVISEAASSRNRNVSVPLVSCTPALAGSVAPAASATMEGIEEATRCFLRGNLEDAERICSRILAEDQHHGDAANLAGMIAYRRGDYPLAVQFHRHAIAIQKCNPFYHSNLGGALEAEGKLNEAAVRYRRAIQLKPELAEAHYNLANVLRAQGQAGRAITEYELALVHKPGLIQARNNLGNIFREQERMDEALACFLKVLEQAPACAEAQSNWGNVLRAQGDLEEAMVHYRLAITLNPQLAEPQYNLAVILHSLSQENEGQLRAAAVRYECALAANPSLAEAHYNLGCIFETLGDPREALTRYRRAIALRANFAKARLAEALLLVQQGQLAEGWRNYEWRWQSSDHETAWRPYAVPLWTGGKVESAEVFIWGEQGIGDEIMFAGWVPDAIRTGSRCTLECDRRLQPLFARSFPEATVVSRKKTGSPLKPLDAGITAHTPSGSLPGLFCGASAEVSRSSYLVADAAKRDQFRERYVKTHEAGTKPCLIGLSWHSRSPRTGRRRSMELACFAPLISASPRSRWISLQYGDHPGLQAEIAEAHVPVHLDSSVNALTDIDTYAAQISALDLVITIDNSTAHLAGALGVPVWLLLPFAADWRWLEARGNSPWYASLRLFRQSKRGDWVSVLEQMQTELRALHPKAAAPHSVDAAPPGSPCSESWSTAR